MVTLSSVAIFTRSMNEPLYNMATSLLNPLFPRFRLVNYEAIDYLIKCSTFADADWIVNLDEDAFVFNNDFLLELLNYMSENGLDMCGVPDGGVVKHRYYNPLIPNPFFNIFNSKIIREIGKFEITKPAPQSQPTRVIKKIIPETIKKLYREVYRLKQDQGRDLQDRAPLHLLKDNYNYKYEFYEEYYKYFFYLFRKGIRVLYLDAIEWDMDNFSTIVKDHLNRPFLIHAWESRQYGIIEMETDRITKAYLYAKNQTQVLQSIL